MRFSRRLRARFTVILAGVAVMAGAVTGSAERIVLEAILVRVNDRIVTITDFRDRLQQELSQVAARPDGDELQRYAQGLFETVVEELVLLERAREKRLTIEETAVDEAIDGLREENNLTDDRAFEEALAGAGLTIEALKNRYRQNMLLHRAVQGEVMPTEITQEEVRKVYEKEKESFRVPPKVSIEQLFFATADDDSDREEVQRRVRGLVSRVRSGADLTAEATLAGIEVQELGAIPEADLRPDLAAALDGLDEGGVTDPLSVAGGFQVVQLLVRLPAGHQPLDEASEQLRRWLSQEAYLNQTRGLVDKLKEEYLVEVHPELLNLAIADVGNV